MAICWLEVNGFAAQITGTVTNGTTGKPAAGVEVVLLTLTGAMDESGKATADAQGRFTMNVPDPASPHLLRVNYQNVNYFQNAPPGIANADITIYNSAQDVAGIFEDARVYRMQTENGQLVVMVTYTLRNESAPPRTKMGEETFEVELPPGAQLLDATAAGPGGMPVATSPVPTGKQNRYALVFPIRPGQSQFKVSYKLTYSGSYEFNFAPDSQLSELGVLLPKSMQFNGLSHTFSQDVDEAGLAVFFAKNVPAHEQVRFSVTGEGVAPREAQGGETGQGTPAGGASPEAATHSNALWYALAGMAVIIVGGGLWLWRKSVSNNSGRAATSAAKPKAAGKRAEAMAGTASSPDSVLEALKDELFQLERDRLDGKVSLEDYTRLKAGLDALMRRQLKKTAR
jgi:5-hydroxyisourate hydrolase-like protein (transthyretin family)